MVDLFTKVTFPFLFEIKMSSLTEKKHDFFIILFSLLSVNRFVIHSTGLSHYVS
jgi:hypothetical protein